MSFTYTGDLTVPLQYLRFKLNDKVEEYALYQDEELNYFINQIQGTPTENDLNKVALKILRQRLQEIFRGPSRERAGQVEVYGPSAESLKLAIGELENEIRRNSPAKPYFGGVDKGDIDRNRKDDSIDQYHFRHGRVFPDSNDGFFGNWESDL
ncbi:MAG: hypothetical protein CMF22_10065 [Idiomarinaceae bacterium]|nr:hypothetical protein [Idiomarinaceae bacterium]MBG23786.1 hypothetical protein [Idiomarinaceae bacterium]|tara:strand:+ start:55560 stop:56018 length:459 start_codon:yes stop_codon:yes gene_type:complete